jgi:hypothetical protein
MVRAAVRELPLYRSYGGLRNRALERHGGLCLPVLLTSMHFLSY